jgi:hypothetical protein
MTDKIIKAYRRGIETNGISENSLSVITAEKYKRFLENFIISSPRANDHVLSSWAHQILAELIKHPDTVAPGGMADRN